MSDLRAKTALLAHMRHELRTPVNAILGYSEMLLEDAAGAGLGAPVVADLQKIHTAGETLLALINDILDASKIEARKDFDLDEFGTKIRHGLRTPVDAVIGYSEMLLEDAPPSVAADLERIRTSGRRLLALLEDLVKMSGAAGDGAAGGAAGPAVSASVSSMIQDVVSAISPGEVRASEVGRLLVVDDNEINRDMLGRRLTRQGHTVATVESGRAALDRLAQEDFDLVLLDVMMPEMNGFQVLERLKGDARLRHLPVIMISALDEIDSVVRCIEMGAEDYLPKNFNPTLLRARIGACLEKKRLRDREVLYLRQIEEEKKRSDELLHVILPAEVVEELKTTNAVKPKRYENVAVMFCDIVGFTPYCAQREPEEIVAHLQQLVEAFEMLAVRYQLQKIKTIGDSFMATAGALKPLLNPVENAVRCGLDMVATARTLPAKWEVRCGIHVGPLTAGVVGAQQYLFDCFGDTVNTAARVESNGVPGAVNVSALAWQRIAHLAVGESRGLIKLKGLGDMEVYRVDGLKETEMKYQDLDAPGRAALLSDLAQMPGFLREHFEGISRDEARASGPGGAFSPIEQCWHLADLEREGYGLRIERLLAEDKPLLPDFDGDQVARDRRYKTRGTIAEAIAAFAVARLANLEAFAALSAEGWVREGTQEGVGPIALCDLPSMMREHDATHRAEIEAWNGGR